MSTLAYKVEIGEFLKDKAYESKEYEATDSYGALSQPTDSAIFLELTYQKSDTSPKRNIALNGKIEFTFCRTSVFIKARLSWLPLQPCFLRKHAALW